MATVQLSDAIPHNVVALERSDTRRFQDLYEKGYLIVLKGSKLRADFDFLSQIRIPAPNDQRRKYVLTHPSHQHLEVDRSRAWSYFREVVFKADRAAFQRFSNEVRSVNQQMLDLIAEAFPAYRFGSCPLVWKFQDIHGENLHIDNLDGCEHTARLRAFANLATTPREWAIGAHLRHYAAQYLDAAALRVHRHSPYDFNLALTIAAFGYSNQDAGPRYPRHFVTFEPGDVWFLNSAVTAHQVLRGTLLLVSSFTFPYESFRHPQEALPRLVSDLCGAGIDAPADARSS